MTVESELRIFGIRVKKQEMPPGKVFHVDKLTLYGTADYTWSLPYHERIEVVSPDEIQVDTEWLGGPKNESAIAYSREQINIFGVEIPPMHIPGVKNTLVWTATEERASEQSTVSR